MRITLLVEGVGLVMKEKETALHRSNLPYEFSSLARCTIPAAISGAANRPLNRRGSMFHSPRLAGAPHITAMNHSTNHPVKYKPRPVPTTFITFFMTNKFRVLSVNGVGPSLT